jgi:carbon-monoxide dehydrogenase large subunit
MTAETSLSGSILGMRVTRTEDPGLLTGSRKYVADLDLDNPLQAVFVRSDVAHGTIEALHLDDARAMPGVVDIITFDTLGVAPHDSTVPVHPDFLRPPLADGRVRFVGEPVAMILAESEAEGRDAAEVAWAEIDPLPAVVDAEQALSEGSELIFPEHGSNEAQVIGDSAPNGLEDADVVVRGRYVNQRVAVAPMEPDSFAAEIAADGRLVVYGPNQMPHMLKMIVCGVLGMNPAQVRAITPQVGGGFGGKVGLKSEMTAVAVAAKTTGRPVVWVPTRSEDMMALPHGRGQVQYCELGCKSDGTFTGVNLNIVGDSGAYPGIGAHLPGGTRRMSQGTYDFPAIRCNVAVGVTNTTPVGAYRGAGRPEATAMLERLVDHAAHELGIDPIEIRRRNLLADDVFPFTTLTGNTYDSGRYLLPLETAREAADYDALRAEQAQRRENGDRMLLGIGVSAYVEITAGGSESEFGAVEVHADGTATVFAGTLNHGHGHQTAYAMLVSDQTGIPIDDITLVDGDTDLVRSGGGTGGSRSLQLGGSAVKGATEVLVDNAKQLAARLLEADVADIVVDTTTGRVGVAGVPAQAFTWGELAERAADAESTLEGEFDFTQDNATFPFGAHIAVVEVDSETGEVRLRQHIAVDDCGTVLNPLLVEGQQHGGIASGVGQALFEEVRYDEDGNPITSNFADYSFPSAAELPNYDTVSTETPTPLNPLGAKGIGEAATIGSTPAAQNAVIDAVSHLGVRHIDMPCTSEKVWRAIRAAEAGTLPDPWRDPPAIFERLATAGDAETTETEEGAAAADGI